MIGTDDAAKKRIAALAYFRSRATWTDAQFLAEFCEAQRHKARDEAQAIDEANEAARAHAEWVRRYGAD